MPTIGVSNTQLLIVTTELIEYPKALYSFSRVAINTLHRSYFTTSDHLVTLQCVGSDGRIMQKESWPILVQSWCGQQMDWQTKELSKTKSRPGFECKSLGVIGFPPQIYPRFQNSLQRAQQSIKLHLHKTSTLIWASTWRHECRLYFCWKTGVYKLSALGAISELRVSEGRHGASSILRAQKYQAPPCKI